MPLAKEAAKYPVLHGSPPNKEWSNPERQWCQGGETVTWKQRISYFRKEKWASAVPAKKAVQENESQPFPLGVEGSLHASSLNLTKTPRGGSIPILNVRNLGLP